MKPILSFCDKWTDLPTKNYIKMTKFSSFLYQLILKVQRYFIVPNLREIYIYIIGRIALLKYLQTWLDISKINFI